VISDVAVMSAIQLTLADDLFRSASTTSSFCKNERDYVNYSCMDLLRSCTTGDFLAKLCSECDDLLEGQGILTVVQE
jgi:hypothetical protein